MGFRRTTRPGHLRHFGPDGIRRLGRYARRLVVALAVTTAIPGPAPAETPVAHGSVDAAAIRYSESRIRSIVMQASGGALTSGLQSDRRMLDGARDRFVAARREVRAFDGAGFAGRHNIPFDVDGTAALKDGVWKSDGTFFRQDGSFDGRTRRLVLGEFSLEKKPYGVMSAVFDARVGREHMRSDSLMMGYYIGGRLRDGRAGRGIPGGVRRYGVSVGGYAVRGLGEALYLDGHLSLSFDETRRTHVDRSLAFAGVYGVPKAAAGGALTGVLHGARVSLYPKVSLSYGLAAIGRAGLRGTGTSYRLGRGRASTLEIALSPDLRISMTGAPVAESRSVLAIAPHLICGRTRTAERTSSCQGGAEFGLERRSKDDRSRLLMKVTVKRQDETRLAGLTLNFEHRF